MSFNRYQRLQVLPDDSDKLFAELCVTFDMKQEIRPDNTTWSTAAGQRDILTKEEREWLGVEQMSKPSPHLDEFKHLLRTNNHLFGALKMEQQLCSK